MESPLTQCASEDHAFYTEFFNLNEESDLEDQHIWEAAEVGEENFRYKVLRSRECAIRDCAHKCLVLQQSLGRDNLVARFLQNQNLQSEEKISMSLYATQNLNAGNKRIATLRLSGKNLYLSCSRVEGDPCLLVEMVNDIKELQNDALKLFFFLTAHNAHVFRFESVACPGWYIGTSQVENELALVAHEDNQISFKDFLIFS